MLQAFFNGMSGLFSFSKGLNNVSNNVSNMNTPGYRGNDTFFRSVNGQNGQSLGAEIAGTEMRVKAGESRQTGNSTDLAINGYGFFVLRNKQGDVYFSRAGQFQSDQQGFLVDTVTQHRVAGMNAAGSLTDINIKDLRTLAPTATTKVEMIGSLARTGPTESSHTISSVQVYDQSGSPHALSIKFEPQLGLENSWTVTVTDAEGTTLTNSSITFGADGSPQAGFNTVDVPLTVGGATQTITLDFGIPGSFNLASQVASGASHTLGARVVDGSPTASLSAYAFDEMGTLQFTYSNGEKRTGQQLALADFSDETALIPSEGSMYRSPTSIKPTYGRPGHAQFGRIQGGYIELSNVDLSQEFGDILIIQRGYQASSRVMTVSNEMLEQLYNGTRGG
jgi:flagellar hook protein FlgE